MRFTPGKPREFGQGKHRKARVQRFAAKHPKSDKIPCPLCGRATSRCTCPEKRDGR